MLPEFLGWCEIPLNVNDLEAQGMYAYLACGDGTMRIISLAGSRSDVVTPSGSCALVVKHDYVNLFADDTEWRGRAEELAARFDRRDRRSRLGRAADDAGRAETGCSASTSLDTSCPE